MEERFGKGCFLGAKDLICTAVGATQNCHFLAGAVPFRLGVGTETSLLKRASPFLSAVWQVFVNKLLQPCWNKGPSQPSQVQFTVIEQLLASLSSKIIIAGRMLGYKLHPPILLVHKSTPAWCFLWHSNELAPLMKMWRVRLRPQCLAQFPGTESGVPFTLGESMDEWVLIPRASDWASKKGARPHLFYIWAFLGQFGEREVLTLMAWDHWNLWSLSIALPALFLFLPWTVWGLPVCAIHFSGLTGRPCHGHFKYCMDFVLKVKLPLPAHTWWILFSSCPRVKRVSIFVFISLPSHFLPPPLLPSPCLVQELSGSGAVTSSGSDPILEAFVCSFP